MFGAESRTPSDQSRVAPEESVHVTEAKYDWYLPLQAVEPEYLLPENEQNRLHDYHIEARNAARKEATGKFAAMNDVILTVNTERAFSADHQHQYPLRHHSIRMHIIAAKLIDILHANLLV